MKENFKIKENDLVSIVVNSPNIFYSFFELLYKDVVVKLGTVGYDP